MERDTRKQQVQNFSTQKVTNMFRELKKGWEKMRRVEWRHDIGQVEGWFFILRARRTQRKSLSRRLK